MKTLLIILLALGMRGQNKPPEPFIAKYNAEVHFYGSCLVNDVTYSIQGLIWPNRTPTKKLLISNAMTLGVITGKELYDTRKRNPTGFSKWDFFIGSWAMIVYTVVRICINDLRKKEHGYNNKDY
jgi:hypothetical protein